MLAYRINGFVQTCPDLKRRYDNAVDYMILIRFSDHAAERKALGYLAGRFPFKSSANGDMIVPETALPFLAQEGICFTVHGPAKYDQSIPAVRDTLAPAIQ